MYHRAASFGVRAEVRDQESGGDPLSFFIGAKSFCR
jgi:hypothetical protein